MTDCFDFERFQEVLASHPRSASVNVVVHNTVDSTSSDLKRRLENGAPIGTMVVARHQSAGRGRSGRSWFSDTDKNLYFSMSLFIRGELETLVPLVPLAAGIALIDAIAEQGCVLPRLKWPNDLLIDGRKTAGILCEMVVNKGDQAVLVVGVGVNIGSQTFPEELSGIATSISELDKPVDRSALMANFVINIKDWIKNITAGGVADLVASWCARAEPFGRRVRVGDLEGVTEGLAEDGRLVLRGDDGKRVHVVGGIVESLSSSDF